VVEALIKYILLVLIVGVVLGYVNNSVVGVVSAGWINTYLFNGSLLLLLFVMGLAFGVDKEAVGKLKARGLRILVIPVVVVLGSVLGGLVGGFVLGLNVFGSMAVTSGFGWYTVTGPLLTQVLGSQWGVLGFTANFLRELLTIVLVSVWVRVDKFAAVASGGATTMDTTLPVIVRYCGSDVLVAAFSSGFVLSLLAPFMVLAFASLM
jgi:uncharacterized membrane protein YbjE (DUF340 family)